MDERPRVFFYLLQEIIERWMKFFDNRNLKGIIVSIAYKTKSTVELTLKARAYQS